MKTVVTQPTHQWPYRYINFLKKITITKVPSSKDFKTSKVQFKTVGGTTKQQNSNSYCSATSSQYSRILALHFDWTNRFGHARVVQRRFSENRTFSSDWKRKLLLEFNMSSDFWREKWWLLQTLEFLCRVSQATFRCCSSCFCLKVNHNARAHLRPPSTPATPWRFSSPAEKATARPHSGFTLACKSKTWYSRINRDLHKAATTQKPPFILRET